MYTEQIRNEEMYTRCMTEDDFDAWLKAEGWSSHSEWLESTGVEFGEIKAKWFIVLHNRVFVGTETELPTVE